MEPLLALTEILASAMPFAIGIAVSPIPVIAIVVVLSTNASNAFGLATGWIIGIVAIGILVFAVPGLDTIRNQPTALSGWVRVGLGFLLIWLAVREWRSRPDLRQPQVPSKLMSRVEKAGAGGIIAIGIGLSALNPKVIALTFGGAANIDAYASTLFQKALGLAAFALVASLSLIVPILGFVLSAERAEVLLPKIKEWLIRHNSAVSAAVLLVLGVLLAANGVMIVAA